MAIFKRGGIWWVDITVPGRPRVRESSGTDKEEQAKEYHDKRKAEIWRWVNLGEKPAHTWNEACLLWLKEKKHKRSISDDAAKIEWMAPRIGNMAVKDISREDVLALIDEKLEEGVTEATANRYLSLIGAILNKCEREWGWIDRAPRLPRQKEPTRRIRWLTREEADRLLAQLPAHLSAVAEFALMTGLRQSNVLNLRWEQIDLARKCAWIHGDEAKGGADIAIPLNKRAMQILFNQQNDSPHVFLYEGKPLRGVEHRTWKKALDKAGIRDFRFHDLRHTWASWHVQSGTSMQTLMELGGWKSLDMVLRYAHLSSEHLRKDVERLAHATPVLAAA